MQDFNDNAPEFISPPRNFTIRVPENASIGSEVITVRAIDTDIGSNGQVRYRLRRTNTLHGELAAAVGNFFSVDPVTGRISLVRKLDREEFSIRFCFFGSPLTRSQYQILKLGDTK